MPEYIDHPVKDQKSWEELVKWRLDPATNVRYVDLPERMRLAQEAAAQGKVITQNLIGGFMYLRSLIGPEGILYMVYDQPELVHECMQTWLNLSDAVIARHQEHVTLDLLFLGEDICYNHGSLISPDMMQEFLMPYYQQLVKNTQRRQLDANRKLLVQVDTDGFSDPVIPIYQKNIGMDMMSPFEVASGSDVIRTGREFPELILSGGLDKRILAQSKQAIDKMVDSIIPTMRERGGYIPTIDHGTPEEVPYENYVHFRRRMIELGG
jgi:uroporphyrinogen-III decarboxylase